LSTAVNIFQSFAFHTQAHLHSPTTVNIN